MNHLRGWIYGYVSEFTTRLSHSPLGARLATGIFWSALGSIVSRGSMLLSAILVGRILGRSEYGQFAMFQNTVGLLATMATFGLGLSANKFIAVTKQTDPDRAGRIIALLSCSAWLTSLILATLLFVLAPYVAQEILRAPQLTEAIQAGSLLLIFSGVNGAQLGILTGYESFKRIAYVTALSSLLALPLTVFGAVQWGLMGVVWALSFNQFLICLLCALAIRKEHTKHSIIPSYKNCFSEVGILWQFSTPTMLTEIMLSVAMWGGAALVVRQMGGFEEYGVYSAAWRIKLLPEAFLAMMMAPVLPVISSLFGKDDRGYGKTVGYCFAIAMLVVVPISLLQTAAPSLTLLPFGDEYAGNEYIVRWIMLHAVVYSLMYPMTPILISMDKMWLYWRVQLVNVTLFMLGTWLLVPHYGVVGFMGSMVGAFCLANLFNVYFLYKTLPAVMARIRWATTAIWVLASFGLAVLASLYLPFPAALGVGLLLCCGLAYVQNETRISTRH